MNKRILTEWQSFYHTCINKAAWGMITPDEHVVDFVRHYQFPKEITILDSGCSHGKNSAFFMRQGYNTFGIDLAPEIIEFVRKRLPGGRFEQQLAQNVNFDDIYFDVICDAGCFHVNAPPDGESIIKRYSEILKSSGKMFIRVFNKAPSADNGPELIFYVSNNKAMPVFGYTKEYCLELFAKHHLHAEKSLFNDAYGKYGVHFFYLGKE